VNRIVPFVKGRPLLTFFVLAFAISWSASIAYILGVFPSPILACGPFLAAIIVAALVDGRPGVKALLLRLVQWRVGLVWYLVALLLPITVNLAAVGLNIFLGAPTPSVAQLGGWFNLITMLAVFMVMPLAGPFGEELGWRGFALVRLQARYTALAASLILALPILAWHAPMFIFNGIPLGNVLQILASVIVFTWLFNATKGSVLLVMLAHAAWDAGAEFFYPAFSGADLDRWYWLMGALWSAVALGLILVTRMELSRKRPLPLPTPTESLVQA
jgi:membrane protease YdiL (CAAX protease family)